MIVALAGKVERSNFSHARSSLNEPLAALCTKKKVLVPLFVVGVPRITCESATGERLKKFVPDPGATDAVAVSVIGWLVCVEDGGCSTCESGGKSETPVEDASAAESARKRSPKLSLVVTPVSWSRSPVFPGRDFAVKPVTSSIERDVPLRSATVFVPVFFA